MIPLIGAMALGAVLASPAAARAQTVEPGMSADEVVQKLGKPTGRRTSGTHTYLFYANGCEHTCGMQDVVILENDAVVDALFRAPGRRFGGTSSSPKGTQPVRTPGSGAAMSMPEAPPAGEPSGARGGTVRSGGGAGAAGAAGDTTPGAVGQLRNIREAVRQQQGVGTEPTIFRPQPRGGAPADTVHPPADTVTAGPGRSGGGRENRPLSPEIRPTPTDSARAAQQRQQGAGRPPAAGQPPAGPQRPPQTDTTRRPPRSE